MAHDIPSLVGPAGWATGASLTGRAHRNTLGRWAADGTLFRLAPAVFAVAGKTLDWRVRVEAAVRTRSGALSHGTALAMWQLVPAGGPVHVVVEQGRSGRGPAGVVLHRTRDLADAVRRVEGLPVTCVERAIVDTWGRPGHLDRASVRAAAITAVRRRLCRPADLAFELERRPQLPRRAELAELIRLLADGCQSELEIWGCLHVLRAPGMPRFTQQHRVSVGGRTFWLDAACEEVQLAVELDGAAWHGSRDQRERDIRRDSLLATVGWQTLRYGFRRLTGAAEECQRDIRAAYQARLRLIRGGGVQ